MTALNLNTPILKAIAGIDNFDAERVLMIARAAETAKMPALDIAADPELVTAVRKVYSGTLFVSSLDPQLLLACEAAGADVIELGNFDALYAQGEFIDAATVLRLSQALNDTVSLPLSITVPGHLSLDTQCELVQQLSTLNKVAMIQTEGAVRQLSPEAQTALITAQEKAAISLKNTAVLAKASRLAVMTASGFDHTNLLDAFEAGASAVGVGSAFNRLPNESDMTKILVKMMSVLANVSRQTAALAS